jgi:chloramphenicol 3-O-phosphotransferase
VLSAIAAASEVPWVVFDEPVLGAVDDRYLIWRDQAPGLHRGFLAAIGALSRTGNLVAFSAAGHSAEAIDEALRGLDVMRVGLDCDLETLRARERGREGRWGGLAEGSMSDHDGWRYDLRFDTTRSTPSEIAAEVLRRIPQVRRAT